jgi:glyoxylate reductase
MIPHTGIDLLLKTCDVEINTNARALTGPELLAKVKGYDGVIGVLTDRIDAEFFDAAKIIKGYANFAVGFDNIDVAEATRRKIPVSNTPDVLTEATAEMAWALLFAVARRVTETERIMRAGQWPGWDPLQFIGADVGGKTLGIVGAGRIGTSMALKSRGFNMPVLYCSPSPNPTLEKEVGARRVALAELLMKSDFISIHVPLTPETHHMFNADTFEKMKSTAYLINTARGPIIHEAELVEALTNGKIAGAALDVYEFEPKMVAGLAELENAVTVPHVGSATPSAREGMSELAARNLIAMLQGAPGPSCLNPEVFG